MDIVTFMTIFFITLVGLCFGSFLNVVVLRGLSGESISYPPSKCPKCGKSLLWWHNIPLLSYILLKGKCYFCKTHISFQYPIVEAITAILFVFAYLKFGMSVNLIFLWSVIFMSLAMIITDIKEHVICLQHAITMTLIGLTYFLVLTGWQFLHGVKMTVLINPFMCSVEGILLGGLIMLAYFGISYVLAGGRMGTGDGDIYITMAMGACYGWQKIIPILIIAFLLHAVIATFPLISETIKEKNYRLLGAFVTVITLIILQGIATYTGVIKDNVLLTLFFAILLVGSAIYLCKKLLENVITRKSEGISMPFGPALLSAGLLIMFFSVEMISGLQKIGDFIGG